MTTVATLEPAIGYVTIRSRRVHPLGDRLELLQGDGDEETPMYRVTYEVRDKDDNRRTIVFCDTSEIGRAEACYDRHMEMCRKRQKVA